LYTSYKHIRGLKNATSVANNSKSGRMMLKVRVNIVGITEKSENGRGEERES
jgi:hypothetical protein